MGSLRVTKTAVGEERYQVLLEYVGPDEPQSTATAEFDFRMSEQNQADLRWYGFSLHDGSDHPELRASRKLVSATYRGKSTGEVPK